MFRLLIFSIFDEAIAYPYNYSLPTHMSKNNDANRKKNKKQIDQKKRKIQNAEAERKARLKQIQADFKAKENDNKL
ncbi:hypothetical protein [Chryseobacterium pennae]|uniref:hypothetical protein n=2 Tax=Chryseobacterium TaxID=59732 RepID=UPI000F5114D0|nr:hypothetical protein [Chryseobacterium pennae]